jgi:hypothetical protein
MCLVIQDNEYAYTVPTSTAGEKEKEKKEGGARAKRTDKRKEKTIGEEQVIQVTILTSYNHVI